MEHLTVAIDEELLAEAKKALGARTKRDAVVKALREAARRGKIKSLLRHMGRVDLGISLLALLQNREAE